MNKAGLRPCSIECMQENKKCKKNDCRLWIDFEEDHNCCLVAIYEHGPMTLREIGERIGVSFARIKQIETAALKKMRKNRLLQE